MNLAKLKINLNIDVFLKARKYLINYKICKKCNNLDKNMETLEKCIVKGCTNHRADGEFVGDLCKPCHIMLTEGRVFSGAAWFAEEINILKTQEKTTQDAIKDFMDAWRKLPSVPGYTKPPFEIWLSRQLWRHE